MVTAIHIVNVLLPMLILASFTAYLIDFIKGDFKLNNVKRLFLFITLLMHAFYLIMRTSQFNHPPITNQFEVFTVIAFSILFTYFVLELLTDIRGTGVFIIFLALIFQIFSTIYIADLIEVKEILQSYLLGFHVISALLGFSAISIAAAYGIMYLLLYRRIKKNIFGIIFNRLPNLEILEKLLFYSISIGFVLLTIAIGIGIVWLPIAFPDFNTFDPKIISSSMVWIIYGTAIIRKLLGNMGGIKLVWFSLIGFIIAVLSLLLTEMLASSFHAFN